jgi:hypothetical protein
VGLPKRHRELTTCSGGWEKALLQGSWMPPKKSGGLGRLKDDDRGLFDQTRACSVEARSIETQRAAQNLFSAGWEPNRRSRNWASERSLGPSELVLSRLQPRFGGAFSWGSTLAAGQGRRQDLRGAAAPSHASARGEAADLYDALLIVDPHDGVADFIGISDDYLVRNRIPGRRHARPCGPVVTIADILLGFVTIRFGAADHPGLW